MAWLWQKLKFRLSALIGPRMVYGYRGSDGLLKPHTRVSNMTRIEAPQSLQIGDNVWIGHFNFIDASGGLTIGDGCQITSYVSVLTHSSHIAIRLYGDAYQRHSNHIGYRKAASSLGAYTFVGAHSLLEPGVHIGKGALVAAYSHVKTGDYPDFCILAGNPAQVVGDTRDKDALWLDVHPELRLFYRDWAEL